MLTEFGKYLENSENNINLISQKQKDWKHSKNRLKF